MKDARQQVFSGAAFSFDQERCLRVGHGGHNFANLQHPVVGRDEPFEGPLVPRSITERPRSGLLDRALESRANQRRTHTVGDEIIFRSRANGDDGVADGAGPRHGHHGRTRLKSQAIGKVRTEVASR